MRVVTYHLANSVLNFPLDDVRPQQGFTIAKLLPAIAARYRFSTIPPAQAPRVVNVPTGGGMTGVSFQGPLVFQNGSLTFDDRAISIPRIDIAPDFTMIAVHSATTDEGDMVLSDFVELLESSHGFRNIASSATKHYGSNLVIAFDRAIDQQVRLISELQDLIGPYLKRAMGVDLDTKLERIAFGLDPAAVPAAKAPFLAGFTIERRVGHSYGENRWFSSAPMQTLDHVQLLEKIEESFRRGM